MVLRTGGSRPMKSRVPGAGDREGSPRICAGILPLRRRKVRAASLSRRLGLDSMVVGESEILGQAKKAYEAARSSRTAGRYLHRLFQRAFRVAKQVRTHTDITRGLVSVGSVAIDLAQRIFGHLGNCKVLVLGAGETSERTARALASRGVKDLRVSNRSSDRAHELAQLVGGRALRSMSGGRNVGRSTS